MSQDSKKNKINKKNWNNQNCLFWLIDYLFLYFLFFFFEICNMPTLEPKGGGGGGTADFKIEWGKNQNPTEKKKSHAECLSRP